MPEPPSKAKKKRRVKKAIRHLGQLLTLLAALSLVAGAYVALRDFVLGRMLRDTAQGFLNRLATADVDRVGRVEIDGDGNLVLHRIEISTTRNGVKRLFYRAERAVIAIDGWPLKDSDLQ